MPMVIDIDFETRIVIHIHIDIAIVIQYSHWLIEFDKTYHIVIRLALGSAVILILMAIDLQ